MGPLPILTLSLPSTTFGSTGLNFWVRDVTRCFPCDKKTPKSNRFKQSNLPAKTRSL